MIRQPYTHRVAVNAYLLHFDNFLLLKRVQEPIIWCPPGGKILKDEDPVQGLRREVIEETGLEIHVFQPVTTWFGYFNKLPLLSIDYLCTCTSDLVTLSHEHRDYRWLSIDNLRKRKKTYFTSELGFKLADYELAWQTYVMNNNNEISATTQQ
jgi:8-oxo-dGTP pyrophosphatase MutT (NUDIX family)